MTRYVAGGILIMMLSLNATAKAAAPSAMRIDALTCEYREDPVGLDETAPRLAWVLRSDVRAQRQTAYRIVVAPTRNALLAGSDLVWDTGKVADTRTSQIAYAGPPLRAHGQYWWRVQAWDKDGQPTAWSAPARWTMGILDTSASEARWIGHVALYPADDTGSTLSFDECRWLWMAGENGAADAAAGTRHFRRTFDLPQRNAVTSGRCLLTVDDQFELTVNGKAAGKSDGEGNAWRRPAEIDIAPFLQAGRNVIDITARNTVEGPAGLLCKVFVAFEGRKPVTMLSDDKWQVARTADGEWMAPAIVGQYGMAPWGHVAVEGARGWLQKAPSPVFRREVALDTKPVRATAYICGLGFHELHINGHVVGDRVLDPAFTRYDRRCLYVTHDVTDLLTTGANALGVMLGNGWYNVHTRAAWDFDEAPWRAKPSLWCEVHLDFADGTRRVVRTDASWRAATGPLLYDGIRQGEVYDAREELGNWDQPGFDDAGWVPATVMDAPAGKLTADNATPIRVVETLEPVAVREPSEGVFVYDFGQNIPGWVSLRVAGPAGTRVRLRYAERIHADGSLDQDAISAHVYNSPFQTDTYILKGTGVETYAPRFTFHGFQYVEVTGFPGRPAAENLKAQVVHTDFASGGAFACSNPMFNDIQRLTLWAYRGNYMGYPTDCPHREKNGWTGDAHLAAEQAMFNWQNCSAYTKWIGDLADEQREDGALPGICPTGGWGYRWGNGPAWDSAFLLIPWYMYVYEGDTQILARNFEAWKRYVDYLTSHAKDGIVGLGLGDWAPAKTRCPTPVTSTGYYYIDARIVADSARILGHAADAERYGKLADQIRAAYRKHFGRGEGGYADLSQTALSCTLYQGFADKAERPAIAAKLVANVDANNGHLDTGILGAKYLFHALSENGAHDTAYRVATQTNAPSYGWWLSQGATTLWEQWNGGASRNHIMFGDISAWFYQKLAGIAPDPAQPGFKHFYLHPRPVGDLTWVKAHHDCPYGRIKSHWQIKDDVFTWHVTVPVSTTATLTLPVTDAASVREAGQPVDAIDGVRVVKSGTGRATILIPSGTYVFTCPTK